MQLRGIQGDVSEVLPAAASCQSCTPDVCVPQQNKHLDLPQGALVLDIRYGSRVQLDSHELVRCRVTEEPGVTSHAPSQQLHSLMCCLHQKLGPQNKGQRNTSVKRASRRTLLTDTQNNLGAGGFIPAR